MTSDLANLRQKIGEIILEWVEENGVDELLFVSDNSSVELPEPGESDEILCIWGMGDVVDSQGTFSSRCYHTEVSVEIMVPVGTGDRKCLELAESVAKHFRDAESEDDEFFFGMGDEDATITEEERQDFPWYCRTVALVVEYWPED